jgi:hypothetical protein
MTVQFIAAFLWMLTQGVAPVVKSEGVPRGPAGEAAENEQATSQHARSITLATTLEERDPRAFARRLSELLGVEVILPNQTRRALRLEAGSWTASAILESVGKQASCTWGVAFEIRGATAGQAPPERKLDAMPRISFAARLTIGRASRLIAREAGCKARLDESLNKVANLQFEDVPADDALQEIAENAGGHLWTRIRFEPQLEPEAAAQAEEQAFLEALMEQTEQKARLSYSLQEITGQSLDDPGFPWESAMQFLWLPDTTASEMVGLLAQLQAEFEMMRTLGPLDPGQSFSPVEGYGPPP